MQRLLLPLSALLLAAIGCTSAEEPGAPASTASSSSPADADATVLVVAANPSGARMEAVLAGTLRVKDGCYFLGDALLVAPKGSRPLDDGSGIEIPGHGRISIGDEFSGGGGQIVGSPPQEGVTPADAPCVVDADRYALVSPGSGA